MQVYLARWHETPVAVKILIDKDALANADPQQALSLPAPLLAKLDEEAGLLASLRHPNVVNFMGVCREPPCIVTEYCGRGSLTMVLTAAKTDPTVAQKMTWPRRLTMVRAVSFSQSLAKPGHACTLQSASAVPLYLIALLPQSWLCRCWMRPGACCICTPALFPLCTATSNPPTCWWTTAGASRCQLLPCRCTSGLQLLAGCMTYYQFRPWELCCRGCIQ